MTKTKKVTIAWKYRVTQRIQHVNEIGDISVDPNNDSNAVTSGTQNKFTIAGIPYNPSSEIIDVLTYPAGRNVLLSWKKTAATTTINDSGGIDDSTQTIYVDQPDDSSYFQVGDFAEIENEIVTLTSITAVSPADGRDIWTVRRGEHGTDAAAHNDSTTVRKVVTPDYVSLKSLTLSGVNSGLSAPSNLVAKGLQDAIELTWDSNLDEDEFKQLKSFVLYWDDATFASFDPNNDPVPAGVTRIELSTDSRHLFVPRDGSGDIEYTARYFRVSALNLSGVESAVSAEANATASASGGGDSREPTAPTISVLLPGGNSRGQYLVEFGITATDAVGKTGWDKTEIAIAAKDDTWDASTGFSNPIETKTLNPPPCSGTFYLDDEGQYDVSARIYNGAGDVWSDWCSVSTVATSEGQPDSDNPDPATLVISDTDDAVGNNVLVEGKISNFAITGGYWEVMATGNLANWPDTVLGVTGLRNQRSSGGLVNVPIGQSILTDAGADFVTDGVTVGDILYTYQSCNTSTGEIDHAQSWVITARTATTITIDGKFQRSANDSKASLYSPVYYVVAEKWAFQGASPDTHPYLFEPRRAPFSAYFHVLGAKYWRIRFGNKHGLGPFIYHDGSTGTTTKGSATTFTPAKQDAETTVEALSVVESLLAAGAVTEGKLGDSAVTQNKIADAAVIASKVTEQARRFSANIEFSSSHDDRIDWSSGTLKLADGTTYSINSANNTVGDTDIRYIYFDPDVSTTQLQMTTNYANAVGERKIYLCMGKAAIDTDQDALIIPAIGTLHVNEENFSANIVAANILKANSITATEITTAALTGLLIQTTDGGLIRTGSSYPRIELDSSGFITYDSGGDKRVEIPTTWDQIKFYDGSENFRGSIEGYGPTDAGLLISVKDGLRVEDSDDNDYWLIDTTNNLIEWSGTLYAACSIRNSSLGRLDLETAGGTPVVSIDGNDPYLSFYNATPIAKPTVSGARDTPEGALADLLSELANLGLITDSTTAS